MDIQTTLTALYRDESRRILATLIRLLGDFDLAEEALQDAFIAAAEQWPKDAVPSNPRAWLVSAGRFKAIDGIRRQRRIVYNGDNQVEQAAEDIPAPHEPLDDHINDDHLRLIFTCCHPALAREAQVALTLRTVCDLTTEEIASAFLSTPATIAQRIVRAKNKIRDAGIPYELPGPEDLHTRLDSVLQVVYLVFNEGYSATTGDTLTRQDLSQEAIRLGRLLAVLIPDTDTLGLLALMLLHESRRSARCTPDGELILLEEQQRDLWNQELIAEGSRLVEQALRMQPVGLYALQAGIAAVHGAARHADETDWAEIVGFYDLLQRAAPSPVVALNRAVAIAMRDGPAAGLLLLDDLSSEKALLNYLPAHAARADLCRRLGRPDEARTSYERALALSQQDSQRRYLQKRLRELAC
ncbi:MAG TPA: RNA polymerase subunit sigma-24 [Spongiibacteraceae bacterium]|nr:RNA polymerase subunit sigma-24 [Spongiibacteraceae bacterium]HCS28240.1 RNA polymerase subunit sigma-24 [Spongiibacteraceae bacterium]